MWLPFRPEQTSNRLFHLDGPVNSHNNIYWGRETPKETNQKSLHSLKVTTWYALSSKGIIGPFWFQDNDGQTKNDNNR